MFNKRRNILLLILVGLQAGFFLSWSVIEYSKLSNPKAQDILVKTIPVDPRDFISGNYFILHYKFNNIWDFKKKAGNLYKKQGDTIYAILEKEDKYYVPNYISYTKPQKIKENQAVIKGAVGKYRRLEYGIEKYFINEGIKEPNPRKDKIEVLLTIGTDFSPRIKKLYVNDKEFDQSEWQKGNNHKSKPIDLRYQNEQLSSDYYINDWKKIPDAAQYKWASSSGNKWSNELRREESITLRKAFDIANSDDRIKFFFYTKGIQMYLEGNAENTVSPKGPFRYGDVVFFGEGSWYGSAPGLADIYEKK